MADSEIEIESDCSSVDGGGSAMKVTSPGQLEQLHKRIESLQQENRVLKMELETYKLRCKTLQEENRELRKASVTIQARAEQEEEFISNTLMKKIQDLKKEKETLAMNYEQEEEYLTNDLSRKLMQLRQEKVELEQTLEKEQEYQVNKLMRKIERLEADTLSKQTTLEQLRREKVDLENALESEQEALVNRLWKRMDKLEAEKRMLQEKLDQPISSPPSPRDMNTSDMAAHLSLNINTLRQEVNNLRNQLVAAQTEHEEKMAQYAQEERHIREQNLRLQRKLQLEIERREALCRTLSESESSLEMDDERMFNEKSKQQQFAMPQAQVGATAAAAAIPARPRTVSSPILVQSPGSSRPLSPGLHYGSPAFSPPSPMRCGTASMPHSMPTSSFLHSTSPPVLSHIPPGAKPSPDKFVKPAPPTAHAKKRNSFPGPK